MTNVAAISNPADILRQGEIAWHRHSFATIAVPKNGSYVEYVLRGQYRVQQGLAVIKPAYVAHADRIARDGAKIVNLAAPIPAALSGVFELPARACRPSWPRHSQDLVELARDLVPIEMTAPVAWLHDAFDILLRTQSVTATAGELAVSREHLQRSFRQSYCMTPGQSLRELRLSAALQALSTAMPLADLAHDLGFADQSHMSRQIKTATGLTPSQFRAAMVTPVQ